MSDEVHRSIVEVEDPVARAQIDAMTKMLPALIDERLRAHTQAMADDSGLSKPYWTAGVEHGTEHLLHQTKSWLGGLMFSGLGKLLVLVVAAAAGYYLGVRK